MVDLAAGTGRLTRVLASLGCDVAAVEPVDEMRALVRSASEVVAGTAESIPLPDASRDAVFVAEAFHWFDAPAALPEIARVLRPGGGMALMWNVGVKVGEREAWRDEVVELVADVYCHPQGRSVPAATGNVAREDDDWRQGPGWELFEPLTELAFEHSQTLTAEDYVVLVSSWSFVSVLDDGPRAELLDGVRAVLERHGVESFEQRWRTDLYLTRRL